MLNTSYIVLPTFRRHIVSLEKMFKPNFRNLRSTGVTYVVSKLDTSMDSEVAHLEHFVDLIGVFTLISRYLQRDYRPFDANDL